MTEPHLSDLSQQAQTIQTQYAQRAAELRARGEGDHKHLLTRALFRELEYIDVALGNAVTYLREAQALEQAQ